MDVLRGKDREAARGHGDQIASAVVKGAVFGFVVGFFHRRIRRQRGDAHAFDAVNHALHVDVSAVRFPDRRVQRPRLIALDDEEQGIAIDGMSDHTVSQSLYLHDPDGNEVELYVDAAESIWKNNPAAVVSPIKALRL